MRKLRRVDWYGERKGSLFSMLRVGVEVFPTPYIYLVGIAESKFTVTLTYTEIIFNILE